MHGSEGKGFEYFMTGVYLFVPVMMIFGWLGVIILVIAVAYAIFDNDMKYKDSVVYRVNHNEPPHPYWNDYQKLHWNQLMEERGRKEDMLPIDYSDLMKYQSETAKRAMEKYDREHSKKD